MADDIRISADVAALLLSLSRKDQAAIGATVLRQQLDALDEREAQRAEEEARRVEERARRDAEAKRRAEEEAARLARIDALLIGFKPERGAFFKGFTVANEAAFTADALLREGVRVWMDSYPLDEGLRVTIVKAVMP